MITGVFRASYAHVFQPQAPKGDGEPKYQITMLFAKSDQASYQAICAAMNQALEDGVQKVFGGHKPARPKMPLYDGDGVMDNGEPFGEECRGCWVVRASSKVRPSVVDQDIQPILDPNGLYSGCYARASVNFFAFNQNGNRGVGCGLNNIQKIADGEPLSGRTTPEEDFGGRNVWNGPSTYGMALSPTPSGPVPPAGYGGPPQNPPGYASGTSGAGVGPVPPVGYGGPSQNPPGYASGPSGTSGAGVGPVPPAGYGGPSQNPPGYASGPSGTSGVGAGPVPPAGYGGQFQNAPGYASGFPPAGDAPVPPATDPVTGMPLYGSVMGI